MSPGGYSGGKSTGRLAVFLEGTLLIKVARLALCTLWWQKFANSLNGLFTTPSISHIVPYLPRPGEPP